MNNQQKIEEALRAQAGVDYDSLSPAGKAAHRDRFKRLRKIQREDHGLDVLGTQIFSPPGFH